MCGSAPARLPEVASFGDLMDFSGQSAEESHLALQIRSRTELRTGSDGTVSERTSTKLKFHYDLTTADGQHIELNVKAKVRQMSFQDGEGNSISKTEVKLKFSLLQEGVAESLAPLQSDQVPSNTQSGVSDGLQAFLSSVGDALNNFTSGNSATADDLLTTAVDSFNTLLDALTKLLNLTTGSEAPPALPTGNEPDQPPAIAPPPSDSPPSSDPEPTPTVPAAASAPAEPETPTAANGDPANSAAPVPEEPAVADQNSPAADPAPPSAEPGVPASPTELGTQVLQTVKLRFFQSLTQIIRTLAPEQPGDSSVTSQRLDYYSALSLKIHATSLVDVNA